VFEETRVDAIYYYGDLNLDGVVDSNDYDRIDTNWLLWTQEGRMPDGGRVPAGRPRPGPGCARRCA